MPRQKVKPTISVNGEPVDELEITGPDGSHYRLEADGPSLRLTLKDFRGRRGVGMLTITMGTVDSFRITAQGTDYT